MTLRLTSPAFDNNETIPSLHTCESTDISPELQIHNTPDGTESLLLLVTDPDSPSKTWLHWCMFDIHPETQYIPEDCPENFAPQTKNDFGNYGYGGPCPPQNKHQYKFELYALNTKLTLNSDSNLKEILMSLDDKVIERAELVGYYQRGIN